MTVLKVGHRPEVYSAEAVYFDGTSAVPRHVSVTVDEDSRSLVAHAGADFRWPLADIREVLDQAGGDQMVIQRVGDPVQRVILPNRDLAPRLPNRTRSPRIAKRKALFGWSVAALASVALIIFVLVPAMANQLARFIPPKANAPLAKSPLIRSALHWTRPG
ncbi:hypothetical protein MWU54_11275 [Marivita sp. S6314]|uniref:DUF7092 domain-containing protein n=1 Tax=Marivita sp. S6314 TaxID=2926406 RepID=UPI001FF3DFAC|nr:hypothetical protein [Marivita sp. S6314]MCK0150609.1 hypothetical protein [Marivita sp. S6314]